MLPPTPCSTFLGDTRCCGPPETLSGRNRCVPRRRRPPGEALRHCARRFLRPLPTGQRAAETAHDRADGRPGSTNIGRTRRRGASNPELLPAPGRTPALRMAMPPPQQMPGCVDDAVRQADPPARAPELIGEDPTANRDSADLEEFGLNLMLAVPSNASRRRRRASGAHCASSPASARRPGGRAAETQGRQCSSLSRSRKNPGASPSLIPMLKPCTINQSNQYQPKST